MSTTWRACHVSKSSGKYIRQMAKHLVLLIVAITFGIGIIFSVLFTSLYQEHITNSLAASASTNLKFLADSIDSNLDAVNQLVRWSQTNTMIGSYVEAPDNHRYGIIAVNAQERLAEELQNNPASDMIHRVVIGNAGGHFIQSVPAVYSTTLNLGTEIPQLPFFEELITDSARQLSTGLIQDPFYKASEKKVLPIIRPIYARYYSNHAGWIFLELTEQVFTESLQYSSHLPDSSIYLILDSHTYDLSGGSMAESDFSYTITKELSSASIDSESRLYAAFIFPDRMIRFSSAAPCRRITAILYRPCHSRSLKSRNRCSCSYGLSFL